VPGAELGPILLAAVTLVIGYGLRLHHLRKQHELRQQYAEFNGWEKLSVRMSDEVWGCPQCGAGVYSLQAVGQHQDPAESPCAWLKENKAALDELLGALKRRGDKDKNDMEYSASALYDGGSGPGEATQEELQELAELDSMEERGERFRALMERINGGG